MNQIANANSMDTSKLLRFVQDMSDIEQREYLLREAADKLRKEAGSMVDTISAQIESTQKSITAASITLSSYEDRLGLEKQEAKKLCTASFDKQVPKRPKEVDEFYELKEEIEEKGIKLEEESYGIWNCIGELFIALLIGLFAGPVVCAIIFAILAVVTIPVSMLFSIPEDVVFVLWIVYIVIGAVVAIGAFLIIVIRMVIDSNAHAVEHNKMFVRYKFLEPIVDDYEEQIRKYEASHEAFARDRKAKEERLRKITAQQAKTTQMIDKCQTELVSLQSVYDRLIVQKSIEESKARLLESQATILLEKADAIRNYKNSIYEIGIVPPDYRTFDCVTMLAFIFRNNLAQTMTEAILQYEERVFRGEILRGIDNIYKMLGQLSYSMQAIEMRLMEVQQSVDNVYYEIVNVSNELYDIHSDIKTASDLAHRDSMQRQFIEDLRRQKQESDSYSQIEFQNKLLAETKATRYAMDAMSQSMYKAEWYMEQHRQGLL